jgi:hypothetical protein
VRKTGEVSNLAGLDQQAATALSNLFSTVDGHWVDYLVFPAVGAKEYPHQLEPVLQSEGAEKQFGAELVKAMSAQAVGRLVQNHMTPGLDHPH